MEIMRRRISYPIAFNLLILSTVLGTVVLLSSSLFSARAHAQAGDLPCMPPVYAPSRVIGLVPRIPQSSPLLSAVGIFFTSTISILLDGNEQLCLASSPDGRGNLKVDDQLDFHVSRADGSKTKWVHDFRNSSTNEIVPASSQDVSSLFATGRNDVVIFLTDLRPDRHSAEPVWLIIWQSSTPTLTHAPTPTNTPTPVVIEPFVTPTAPVPTQTTRPTLTQGPIATPSPTSIAPSQSWWRNLLCSIESALVILVVVVVVITFVVGRAAVRTHFMEWVHRLASLILQSETRQVITSIKSAPNPQAALRMFDKAVSEIRKAREPLNRSTASAVREYLEALYDSVTRDESIP